MASITGVLDLSQIPQDQFDPQFEFRAAVVRNGAVLGSATLTPRARARQISFQVSFEPPTLPSARLPCPVVLLVGPNVGDQELQSLETLRYEVDLRSAAKPSGAAEGGSHRYRQAPGIGGALCALADHLPDLHDSRPCRLPAVAIRSGYRPLGFLRRPGAGRPRRSLRRRLLFVVVLAGADHQCDHRHQWELYDHLPLVLSAMAALAGAQLERRPRYLRTDSGLAG